MKKLTQLLTYKDLLELLGLRSRTTLYTWINTKKFPKPIEISSKHVRWRSDDIQEWLDSRPVVDVVARSKKMPFDYENVKGGSKKRVTA